MQIHEKPHKLLAYASQSVDGWYLVPLVHHYRCYNFYNIDNGGKTTPDIIAFFPAFMKITNYSTIDMAIHDAEDLSKSLQTSRPEYFFQLGDAQLKSIRGLSQIFDAETKTPNRDALSNPPRLDN